MMLRKNTQLFLMRGACYIVRNNHDIENWSKRIVKISTNRSTHNENALTAANQSREEDQLFTIAQHRP